MVDRWGGSDLVREAGSVDEALLFRLEAPTLPDLAPILSLPATTLRGFAARLRGIGLTRAYLAPTSALVRAIHPVLRPAARSYHLRRSTDVAALAARLLLFEDAISHEEAVTALGDSLSPLLEAGILVASSGLVSSRLVLGLVDDLYLFSDARTPGEDAVLPPGDGTIALLAAAFPERPVSRALDLGCGSGTCALVLARRAERVVATDIHDRALDLTRLNAAINGISSVETRLGSLFEPVAGETFDLLVSQPPFIPKPAGAEASTFLYGGSRGDELPLALIGSLAPHVGERGRAVLLVEWPVGTEPVAARIRRALGENGLDLLVLEAPHVSADQHATEYAASMTSVLDEAFARDATMRREHFEREGISAIVPAFTVIERPAPVPVGPAAAPSPGASPAPSPGASPVPDGRPGWTDTLHITSRARGKVTSARIDKLLGARAVGMDPRRLLSTRLRVPAGTTFVEEQKGPGADKPSSLSARFADDVLIGPVPLTPELLALVTMVHEEDSALAGLGRFAEAFDLSMEEAAAKMLPAIAQALRQGLLEIA